MGWEEKQRVSEKRNGTRSLLALPVGVGEEV